MWERQHVSEATSESPPPDELSSKGERHRQTWSNGPGAGSSRNTPPIYPPPFRLRGIKQHPLPVPPWNVGFILAYVPFKIDSYTSAPDLKRSEGLWVHNALLRHGELRGEGEGEKKKRKEGDDDDLTEPTLNDGSLALKRECLCDCVYACAWVRARTLIQVQTKSL